MRQLHSNISKDTANRDKNLCRDRVDLLLSRVSLLSGDDRLLMTMYLEKGSSFRQLARLTGVSDTIIARRIYKLTKRLADGQYIACLRNRTRLTDVELAIAKKRFLMGLAIKRIAQKHRLSKYRVLKMLEHIQQIIRSI